MQEEGEVKVIAVCRRRRARLKQFFIAKIILPITLLLAYEFCFVNIYQKFYNHSV